MLSYKKRIAQEYSEWDRDQLSWLGWVGYAAFGLALLVLVLCSWKLISYGLHNSVLTVFMWMRNDHIGGLWSSSEFSDAVTAFSRYLNPCLPVAAAGLLMVVIDISIRRSIHRSVWGEREKLEKLVESEAFERFAREIWVLHGKNSTATLSCGSEDAMKIEFGTLGGEVRSYKLEVVCDNDWVDATEMPGVHWSRVRRWLEGSLDPVRGAISTEADSDRDRKEAIQSRVASRK